MLNVSACGYLIFPERVGHTGDKLDVSVVLLDAVGLLFGIIPGVVAFAIDLGTGCIYLPPESTAQVTPPVMSDRPSLAGWKPVAVVAPGAGREAIAAALAEYLAAEGRLRDPLRADAIHWQNAPEEVLSLAAR